MPLFDFADAAAASATAAAAAIAAPAATVLPNKAPPAAGPPAAAPNSPLPAAATIAAGQRAGAPLSLADVTALLLDDPVLNLRQRRDMLSAIATVCRVIGAEPAAIPAQPKLLRQRLAEVSPAGGGISAKRWSNARSLVMDAITRAGVPTLRRRTNLALSPAWSELRDLLPDASFRHGLSRFMSVCSAQHVAPAAVDAAVFAQFRQALDTGSLVKAPGTVYRTSCVLWNRAAADIPGWPRLTVPVPNRSRRYAREWDAFPASFHADACAFLDRLGNQDPFADDYAPSAKPSTVAMRRKQILQLATALADDFPICGITSLAVLVDPANAKIALRFFLGRTGEKHTSYLHQQALLLKTIARHWVKMPADELAVLSGFCSRLTPKHTGMTSKNRTRLRQFDSPAAMQALIRLPSRVLNEVRLGKARRGEAGPWR